jgi:hypothetical protein
MVQNIAVPELKRLWIPTRKLLKELARVLRRGLWLTRGAG